jgi:ElaB/YqjD/DUF883 family membrane-anchored ribosome-binding protein
MAYTNQTTGAAARDTVERAGDTAAAAASRAGDAAKNVSRDVSAAVGQAADMAHDQLDAMTAYVRRNPLQSTAIAAGVGFVFALLARR